MKLPVLASAPCAGCHGPCCVGPVPVTLHDLWRLRAVLGAEWDELVVMVERAPDAPAEGSFALDDTDERFGLELRRRSDGVCAFALDLPGGYRRCGVHGLHPSACRRYPFAADGELLPGAACPAELHQAHRDASAAEQALRDEEDGEAALGRRVLARWERRVHAAGRRVFPVELIRWSESLYEQIERLRRGDRTGWQLAAYRLVERS